MLLNEPYLISKEQLAFYRENGCIKLKNVLSAEDLAYYGEEITRKTIELNTLDIPM